METLIDQEAFFTSPLRDYLTLADMARQLRVSLELVKKLVEKNNIRHARRHGVVRLWNRVDIDVLRAIIGQAASRTT